MSLAILKGGIAQAFFSLDFWALCAKAVYSVVSFACGFESLGLPLFAMKWSAKARAIYPVVEKRSSGDGSRDIPLVRVV